MHLEQIPRFLDRLHRELGLVYRLGWPNTPEAIRDRASALGVVFPTSIEQFFEAFDGLEIEEPHLQIFRLAELTVEDGGLLPFACFDRAHRVAFDTRSTNVADQWDIVNARDGNRVTYSMAAFWTDHIWNWVRFRTPIWTYNR